MLAPYLFAALACQDAAVPAAAAAAVAIEDFALEVPFPIEGAPSPIVHRYRAAGAADGAVGFAGLVLVSGWASGGGWYHRLAGDLAARGGIEVWVLERRECFLEDRALLAPEPSDAASDPVVPDPGDKGREILRELSLASLCRDVAAALERMGAEGARTRALGGWSASGPFLASFAAFELDKERSGLALVDGLVAFDSELHWPAREDGETLAGLAASGPGYDAEVTAELVAIERAARTGRLADVLDGTLRATSFAELYDVAFGRDCPPERMQDVYLGPGRPHEWFFPLRYHADTFQLHGRALVWKEQGFSGTRGAKRPAFLVLSRALLGESGGVPDGVRWFEREIAGGQLETVKVPELGHAGILVADRAVELVYAPLARWLRKLEPAAR